MDDVALLAHFVFRISSLEHVVGVQEFDLKEPIFDIFRKANEETHSFTRISDLSTQVTCCHLCETILVEHSDLNIGEVEQRVDLQAEH